MTLPHYNTQIRQGRVERITEKEVIFKNGHRMPTTTTNDTLYVDCSTASTGFAHPKVNNYQFTSRPSTPAAPRPSSLGTQSTYRW